jgi:hypothetical protein
MSDEKKPEPLPILIVSETTKDRSITEMVARKLKELGAPIKVHMLEEPHALAIEPLDTTMITTVFQGKELTEADGPTFRSCWECNSAHEHLRSVPWLVCIGCNKTFKKGIEQ